MRLLIAEDHMQTCRLLQTLLTRWGFQPVAVADGLAALEALRAPDAPRLALLDWGLPGMDGIEVCRRLRQDPDRPYTYIVLLTGQGRKEDMLDGLDAGADDFLVKPVDAHELSARLNAGRRIVALQEQLLAAQRQLREQASRDSLTGLWNRAAILDILDRELARARREQAAVGVVMADLDHFKRVNDTYGHLAGDEVLRQAARRLLGVLRPYDTVGRYGGEEFLLVLPGCDAQVTLTLAERLCRYMAAEPLECEGLPLTVTVSLGLTASGGTEPAGALLRAADAALYRAKAAGRNRVALGSLLCPAPPAQAPATRPGG
jgi:diguanylate cyclase (GGDEF)-like protein